MATIELEHGAKITTYDPPPADFDPSTASDAQLRKHGFPFALKDPAQREMYEQVKKRLKGRFHYVPPTFEVTPNKFHGPRKPAAEGGAETSGNWSGSVVYAPSGQWFDSVTAHWVVPNVAAPTQNAWYYSCNWVGMDGDGSPDVCQAGVECDVYQSGTNITRNIYAWIEWYPTSEVKVTSFTAAPGDLIYCTVCTAQGKGATTASVSFTNATSGAATSFNLTAPTGTKLVGNCAEWIVEAPTVNNQPTNIADFGEVFFSASQAVLNNGTVVYGGTGNSINLTRGSSTPATGSLITSSVVLSTYTGAQP